MEDRDWEPMSPFDLTIARLEAGEEVTVQVVSDTTWLN